MHKVTSKLLVGEQRSIKPMNSVKSNGLGREGKRYVPKRREGKIQYKCFLYFAYQVHTLREVC